MELFELIQTLNTAHGPSGDEGAVREVIAALARPHADEVTADTLGNLIVRKRGSGPKVMLCAHMDSTGLIVTHIGKEGFLRVGTLGGIAARELLYTPVRFKNGVRGVIVPEEKAEFGKLKLDACYVLATQYFNDDTWNQEKIDNLTIPSIEGYEDSLDDPNMTTVAEVFFNASNVQLWYDQSLPASVTEVHKDCMNALFGLESTPQEIGEQHDAAMQEYLASR